jgi:hypothetical protein
MIGLFIFAGLVIITLGILFRLFKWSPKMILSLLIGLFLLTGGGIYYCCLPPKVAVQAEYLGIKGVYGMKLDYREIMGVTLSNTIPPVAIKTNGFNFGHILKGDFKLKGVGTARLYVNGNTPPYICIATKRSYIIMNYPEKAETVRTFGLIRETWRKQVH